MTVKFQGNPHLSNLAISNNGLHQLIARHEVAYFYHSANNPPPLSLVVTSEFQKVLDQFPKIMQDSVAVLPSQPTDQCITLSSGAQSMNLHLYHYHMFNKMKLSVWPLNVKIRINTTGWVMAILCRLSCPKCFHST